MRTGLISLLLLAMVARATENRVLHIVQVVPSDASNHTVGDEFRSIKQAADHAIANLKRSFPSCPFRAEFNLRSAPQDELFGTIKRIASDSKAKSVVVGFSRSSMARLAAKAAEGTSLIGISVGAATDTLHSINPNFVSMSAPLTLQWKRLPWS